MAAGTASAVVGKSTVMDIINSYTSLDAKASYIAAAEVLARQCPFFMDAPMKPSNQIFSNVGARNSYIPTPGSRRFNEGVAPTAVHSTPFTEGIAMFEDYSEVDATLYSIQNDPNQWRAEQDAGHMEGMIQKAETQIIYGRKSLDPATWDGLCTWFNSLTHRPNGDTTWPYNVIDAGGSGGDTTSILIVGWGPKCHLIYPPNLPAGIKLRNLGEVTAIMGDSPLTTPLYMQAFRTHMALYFGLNIADERYVQRYTNIEVSGASYIFDPDDLVTMLNRVPSRDNLVIYCNRDIKTAMDINALNKSNGFYTQQGNGDIFGRPVTVFQGIPVRQADMIVSTETVVGA